MLLPLMASTLALAAFCVDVSRQFQDIQNSIGWEFNVMHLPGVPAPCPIPSVPARHSSCTLLHQASQVSPSKLSIWHLNPRTLGRPQVQKPLQHQPWWRGPVGDDDEKTLESVERQKPLWDDQLANGDSMEVELCPRTFDSFPFLCERDRRGCVPRTAVEAADITGTTSSRGSTDWKFISRLTISRVCG